MHTQSKRVTLVMISRLLEASTKTCRLAIHDSLVFRVEFVSWPAALESLRQYEGTYEHLCVFVRTGYIRLRRPPDK